VKNNYIFKDSRETFNETFLFELPQWTIPKDYSVDIIHVIREKQTYFKTINLGNNFYKMEGPQLIYYWYEQNGNILLGAEFKKEHHAVVVNFIGKPNKGTPLYASDLYLDVLADRKNIGGNINAIVTSDQQLSDEGFNIWAKLLKDGHKVTVYNPKIPNGYIKINSSDELKQYFNKDNNSKDYRYVLSESPQDDSEIRSFFNLRRLREVSGIL
jgi:hypothetical protein